MANHSSIGVIGPGSFGTAIANLLPEDVEVNLLCPNAESAKRIEAERKSAGQSLNANLIVTDDARQIAEKCKLLFPIVPSQEFKTALNQIGPHLTKDHILIHGTKGMHLEGDVALKNVYTMSQLIEKFTDVEKIGCLAGPNLAREIAQGKPAATVIASKDKEVQELGQQVLRSSKFQVLWNDDIYGVELCGVLKNIMAIPAGALSGFELGDNARALLVNRAMVEMIHIGKALGSGLKAFVGIAGMGDLVATCSSPTSRNFSFGYQLAKGSPPQQIMQAMEETAEGVNTTKIIYQLSEENGWKTPITKLVYKVIFEDFPINKAVDTLMKLPVREDIDFID